MHRLQKIGGEHTKGAFARLAKIAQRVFGSAVGLVADGDDHRGRLGGKSREVTKRCGVDNAGVFGDDPGDGPGDDGLAHQLVVEFGIGLAVVEKHGVSYVRIW